MQGHNGVSRYSRDGDAVCVERKGSMSRDARGAGDMERLYQRERARVYARCLAMLGDPADAEDAVQETFARVGVRLSSLHGDPAGYLLAVARNVCHDEMRRRRRSVTVEQPEDRSAPAPGADDTAVDRHLLATAWEALTETDRTLLAYTFCGLSQAEIGQHVGLGVAAVAQRVSRARRRARRLVAAPAALLWPFAANAAARLASHTAGLALRDGPALVRLRAADPAATPVLAGLLAALLALLPSAAPPAHPPSPARPPIAMAPAQPVAPAHLDAHRARSLARNAQSLLHQVAPPAARVPSPPLPPSALPGLHITAFTPSPQYGSGDHTLFATGTCDTAPGCAPLARSDDAGRSWRPLGGAGLVAGARLLVPPDFPADPVLFAIAPLSRLVRSADGGATFTAVTPETRGDAAIDPDSPPGDTHVYLVSLTGQTLLLYSDRSRRLGLDSALPLDVDMVTAVFTGRGAHRVYAGVNQLVAGGGLYACGGGAPCERVGPGVTGTPSVSPTFGADRTYFAFTAGGIIVNHLDGAASRTVATGWASTVSILPAADYATSGRLDLVVRGTSQAEGLIAMLRYIAGAAQPVPMRSGWTADVDFATTQRLPDATIIAGRTTGGIACSHDDGASFAATC